MADTQSLLDYLMVSPPGLPTQGTKKSPNTTSDQYNWRQISSVNPWTEFTYAHVMQRYGALLQQAQISIEPMPDSPAQPINTERMFAVRFNTYLQCRLRRALRAGFHHLEPQLDDLQLTPITVDIGGAGQSINFFRPDIVSSNRCPGVLKVSWKWGSDWETAASSSWDRREYFQVLSQVNFYMKQHHARYGFVLTDTELVPIKRLDAAGNLLVARAIPWETAGPGRMTVLLGLWYLGMLGAANNDWQLL